MRYVILLFALAACGDAFELADAGQPLEKTPSDSGDDGIGGGDAAVVGDAGEPPEASTHDAGRDVDIGTDSSACTPGIPGAYTEGDGCGTVATPAQYPAAYPQSQTPCVVHQTPIECQCLETYTCACLHAHAIADVCGARAWGGCTEQPGRGPMVTCQ